MRVKPHDSVESLRDAIQAAHRSSLRDRVRMVLYAREGSTALDIAARLECSERVVRKWVNRYNNHGGLAGLATLPRSGRPRKLSADQEPALRARLDKPPRPEDGVCALRGLDVKRILAEELGARYSLGGTYVVLRRLGYRSLVPRPQHPKADPKAQEEFQKNTPGDGAGDRPHASRRRDPDLGAG